MEKLIGLHMYEVLVIMEKEIRGRKMAERLGNVQSGYMGKGLAETQKQGIELWQKKAEMETREGGKWKRGREERGINPSRC